jgi:hypothetical protein
MLLPVRFSGGFQMVDHPDEFFTGMGDCYVGGLAKRDPNMFAHWALGWKP